MSMEEGEQAADVATETRPRHENQASSRNTNDGNRRDNDEGLLHRILSVIRGNPAVWLNLATALAGVLVAFYTFFIPYSEPTRLGELQRLVVDKLLVAQQEAGTAKLRQQLNELQEHIASISQIPKEDALYLEIKKLSSSIDDISAREGKLEAAIMQSPSKALEVPLLRRDLDNLKDSQQSTFSALKDGVDRIYDLNKWLLGAMAISIVTLAVSNLLKREAKS